MHLSIIGLNEALQQGNFNLKTGEVLQQDFFGLQLEGSVKRVIWLLGWMGPLKDTKPHEKRWVSKPYRRFGKCVEEKSGAFQFSACFAYLIISRNLILPLSQGILLLRF